MTVGHFKHALIHQFYADMGGLHAWVTVQPSFGVGVEAFISYYRFAEISIRLPFIEFNVSYRWYPGTRR